MCKLKGRQVRAEGDRRDLWGYNRYPSHQPSLRHPPPPPRVQPISELPAMNQLTNNEHTTSSDPRLSQEILNSVCTCDQLPPALGSHLPFTARPLPLRSDRNL